MMKKIYTLLLVLIAGLNTLKSQNQTHTETAYVPGEVIIQLHQGSTIESVLNAFSKTADVRVISKLSDHMRFWQLGFNHAAISNVQMLAKLRELPAVRIAQNNHY